MQKNSAYTLADVQSNLEYVAATLKREGMPVSAILQCSHSLIIWIKAHGLNGTIKAPKDMCFIEAFWGLCETFGIKLREKDKIEVVVHFLRIS